ncbi:uncharacterized protein LOC121467139 [Drosophila elegans]|uniref:uncharacterized protein LOC121467139 n=1 Tax=Drosophila elegans TaxID=30023 RepID=UPI001BC836FC|nr:uncharacterized protein LOC121467139 [Drosophila elegans]
MHTAIDIDASLRRFWELEYVNQELHRKPENDEVEQHFLKIHTWDPKGRYIVELPFKDPNKQFSDTLTNGNSLNDALRIGPKNHGKEEVKTTALTTQEVILLSPIEALAQRVSSWTKMVRIAAYSLRFIQRIKAITSGTLTNCKGLTFEEMQAARILCLQDAQKCFKNDYNLLMENKPLQSRSQLIKLSRIISKDGLLQVGGRLDNSQLPADVKHPIFLPKSHSITRMILEHEHASNLHPGVSAFFVIIRQKYWVFGARNLIRNLVHNCIKFFRQRNQRAQEFMADLPGIRITEALPFQHSGCNYAGPFILKERSGRNARKIHCLSAS